VGWTEISRHATQEEATAVTRSILAMAVVLAMAAAMFASPRGSGAIVEVKPKVGATQLPPTAGLLLAPLPSPFAARGARQVLLLTVKNLLFPAALGALPAGSEPILETRCAGTDDALPAFYNRARASVFILGSRLGASPVSEGLRLVFAKPAIDPSRRNSDPAESYPGFWRQVQQG
jgi:hypothetical protein